MYTFQPTSSYKYSTKLGDKGESVAALQVNLSEIDFRVVIDGTFGPLTDSVVKSFQQSRGLVVDGIAGPATQNGLCRLLMNFGHLEYATPTGLLMGICENESGYIVAAYAAHASDAGFDLGPFQDAFPPRSITQFNYERAYDAKASGAETASILRTQKEIFIKAPFSSTNQRAWQLAALYHNWPFAATNLANHNHIYTANPAEDNQYAQWVYDASGGKLSTPLEWVNSYIFKSCKYVTNWTP